MKTLYALLGALIVILVIAAFNPDTVVDAYEVAKIRLVEMPRAIEDLNQRADAADDGDMHAMYDIAWYHIASANWYMPEYYPDVLGPRNPERGLAMMRDAAKVGHADALYMLSQHDGHNEDLFVEALEAGSRRAIGKAWSNLTDNLCDDDAYARMMIVREHAGDPGYPWTGTSPWLSRADEEMISEQRRAWWSDITSNLSRVDSLRAEMCQAS